jgi:protocatechuate 3,4-dioxygenase beta subunit
MDNDDRIVGRILSRREVLGLVGGAGLWLAAGAQAIGQGPPRPGGPGSGGSGSSGSSGTYNVLATPEVTEGPFFVDENLNRSNLVEGATDPNVFNGLPLSLVFAVHQVQGSTVTPLSGAHVDVWHANAAGIYSDEPSQPTQRENTEGLTWLRGYQVTDANGTASFATIYPGWYTSRAVHIHFKVRLYSEAGQKTYEFTSQLFFDESLSDAVFANAPYNSRGTRRVTNATDMVYAAVGPDGAPVGSHLMLDLGPAADGTGYVGTFAVGLQIP